MQKEVLRIENVTVEANGITYLDDFSMHIFAGEIMGLIGMDSHGKAQLLRLLSDNIPIKYGRVYYNEQLVNTYMTDAKESNRIFVIGRESKLVEGLTVADNIFVLRKGFKKYVINRQVLDVQVQHYLKELDVDIPSDRLISELSPFESRVVELIKAIIAGSSLIVIYEISEMLSSIDLPRFQKMLRFYADKGISFLYVGSHHEEMFRICSRCSLFHDGKIIKVLFGEELDTEHIAPFVKEAPDSHIVPSQKKEGLLVFEGIYTENLHDFTCSIKEGQCVTIFDKNNTTLNDLAAVTKVSQYQEGGDMWLMNQCLRGKAGNRLLKENVMLISDNPTAKMIFYDLTYMENLCFLVDRKIRKSRISGKVTDSIFKEYFEELGEELLCNDISELEPEALYNIIYYRVILGHPRLVVIAQPFLGADMYLRLHIAKLINRLKEEGITILILTAHMADTLAVSDRLLVIENGCLIQEHEPQTEELIRDNYYGDRFVLRRNRPEN